MGIVDTLCIASHLIMPVDDPVEGFYPLPFVCGSVSIPGPGRSDVYGMKPCPSGCVGIHYPTNIMWVNDVTILQMYQESLCLACFELLGHLFCEEVYNGILGVPIK